MPNGSGTAAKKIHTTTATRRRRRFDFAAGHQEIMVVSALRHGLDPSVLKTIPVIVFDPKEFRDGLECAVCLCEVSEGEKARLLPKCNHGFHVDCIDMWFQSHSTCPLCRNPVANQNQSNSAAESTLETILQAPIGENSEPSSSSSSSLGSTSGRPDGISVIDIPRQINEEEEQKSPVPQDLVHIRFGCIQSGTEPPLIGRPEDD
ncbi:RING-H2 finger protein ATL60 [Sesamum angolense]|uniref:RING-type E3 ubiquitin transferase n=1 Tax=Sesamum angolense TaxID=2727404 RepID=A0AAE2BRE9_9LAMI|nr:RING-H2 finger protein ATL60 [Sesamum angolense]